MPQLSSPKRRAPAHTSRQTPYPSTDLRKANEAVSLLVQTGYIGECHYPPTMLPGERFSI
jgi:hypothetical protein